MLHRPLAVLAVFGALMSTAHAGEFFETDGVAIKGYDPVAYFTQHQAVQGVDAFTTTYHGSTFRFANAQDRDLFVKDPGRYAPQYHGYCTYGVSEGAKVASNPAAYRIVDGKLYLNYNQAVSQKFDQDVPGNLRKAAQNWPTVQSKPEEK